MADPRATAPLSRSAVSWAFVESARTSYVIVIAVYMFVPYLSAVLVGDPVKGQALVAQLGQWAGLLAAAVAPLMGTTIDHLGRRKRLLVVATLAAAPLCWALWFAQPGGLSILEVAVILAGLGVLFSLTEVLHNSLIVHSALPHERARASGLAYVFGSTASILVMLFVLWAFLLPGTAQLPGLPSKPLFGLSQAAHEPERITGPLIAVLLVVSVIPMALFAKDAPSNRVSVRAAFGKGLGDLRGLLGLLREAPQARAFLIARMIYTDGMGTFVVLVGVFAAGVLGWGPTELLIEGLVGSVFSALGGVWSSWVDPRIGSKRSLIITLAGSMVCLFIEMGLGKNHLFWMSLDPAVVGRPWSLPIFDTWAEWVFIGCDFAFGVFSIAVAASSRTLMAELAPPGRTTAFFGLFALSGRATAWICPMLVGAATTVFVSQQLGFLPVMAFFLIGTVLLACTVRPQGPGPAPHVEAPLTRADIPAIGVDAPPS